MLLYLVGALGVVAVVALCWLAVKQHSARDDKRRGLSWRRSDQYRVFVASLSQEQKARFLLQSEGEQYRVLLDWSLRETSEKR